MKRNAAKSVPLGGVLWDGGAETFIHKGTNGRWRDVLSAGESAAYEAKAKDLLGLRPVARGKLSEAEA